MKKMLAAVAVAVMATFGAGLVEANQCPLLIKQLNDGIAKMADKGKAAEAQKLVAEAQKLHEEGKHADSVKKCDEAAKVAGITLKKKM
jgi:hypothetical protein